MPVPCLCLKSCFFNALHQTLTHCTGWKRKPTGPRLFMISTLTLVNWLAFVEAHPHDFTIQYPARREYFIQNFRCEPAPRTSEWLSDLDQLLLYLHIPFCEAKCYYCNFAVDVNRSEDFHRKYVDALLRELDSHADWLPNCEIAGVDIGGGTPTILATAQLRRIARAVKPLLKKKCPPVPIQHRDNPANRCGRTRETSSPI